MVFVQRAHATQLAMSKLVIRRDTLPEKLRLVAGVDVAYSEKSSIAAATVLNYDSLSLAETRTAQTVTKLPYIPTLLSFREMPPAIAAVKKLRLQPDVFIVDGQGLMHPYRLGFASHLGLVMNRPTVGVAKNPLTGDVGSFNESGWAPVIDRQEVIGAALLTRKGARPVYVSIGHMVSLKRAIEVVKHCSPKYRIPEPIRLAHDEATKEKRKIKKGRSLKRNAGAKS